MTARTRLLIIVTTIASLALAGCGDDSKSKSSSTTSAKRTTTTSETSGAALTPAAIGGTLLSGSDFGADAEQCVGQSVLDSLGKDGVRQAMAADKPTAKEAKALGDAMDKCVTADQLASSFVDEIAKEANITTGTESLKTCVSQKLTGKVGATFEAMGRSGSDEAASKVLLDVVDECPTDDFLRATIKTELGTEGVQISDQVVDCIVGKLAPTMKLSDLAAGGSGLEQQATAAAQTCAAGG